MRENEDARSSSEVGSGTRDQVDESGKRTGAPDESDTERGVNEERAVNEEVNQAGGETKGGSAREGAGKGPGKTPKVANNVRKMRIERMVSKAELARRANLSVLTIDRVERGYGCRMDTKRKILEALGLSLADRVRVFGEEE